MSPMFLYIIIGILLIGFGVLLYILLALKKQAEKPVDDGSMKVMMEWMKEIKSGTEATREGMQKSIDHTNKAINERLDNAGRVIAALQKELGGVAQIGPDIRRLSETLASPKLRGNFGEEMLENMMSQVLPRSGYTTQYKFRNGETVDAIVRIGEKILPVDSKFSMENFRLYKEAKTDEAAEGLKKTFLRDVKKRIDEIHRKYILPHEGTLDFAVMYVPSEGVFQELIIESSITDYSREKRVTVVGPNSFFAILQSVIVSLRALQINRTAQQILDLVTGIKQESDKFSGSLGTLTNHIKNAGNTMSTVNNDFVKLAQHIYSAADLQLDEHAAEAIPDRVGGPEK